MGSTHQHADAGRINVRDLGEIELDAIGRLLQSQVDGIAELVAFEMSISPATETT